VVSHVLKSGLSLCLSLLCRYWSGADKVDEEYAKHIKVSSNPRP